MSIQINGTSGISGVDGTAGTPALQGTDSNTGISFGADQVNINTGGTTRATVDSSGRVLVGTSSSRVVGNQARTVQLESAAAETGQSIVVNSANQFDAPAFVFGRSRGTSLGSNTAVQSGDVLAYLQFCGADGTDLQTRAAEITCEVDGTPGANDMPGRLVFSTTADGASSPTERMRITQNGIVKIGTTGSSSTGNNNPSSLLVENSEKAANFYTTASSGYSAITVGRGNTGGVIECYFGTTYVGGVNVNSTSTQFPTTSDYRLKENIVPLTGAVERLSQLQVHRFNFIADPGATVDGFIAHEVQSIVPEAIVGEKDAVNEDGSIKPQGIDQSKLVPLLTAALQEALGRIETLEAEVAALKAQ